MTPADRLYTELVDHHATCRECSPAADCPDGARILMAWGEQEALEERGQYRSEIERDLLRNTLLGIPDYGERTDA